MLHDKNVLASFLTARHERPDVIRSGSATPIDKPPSPTAQQFDKVHKNTARASYSLVLLGTFAEKAVILDKPFHLVETLACDGGGLHTISSYVVLPVNSPLAALISHLFVPKCSQLTPLL